MRISDWSSDVCSSDLCDLRFAARSATFLTAFDRIGASGDFGSTWFWTRIVGTGVARELFFLGEKLSAEEAFAKGLYTRSEEHTSELQSLMRISYAVFCLNKKKKKNMTKPVKST